MARLQMRFEDVRWEVMEEEQAPTTQRANRRSIALTIGHRTKKAYPWGPIFLRCGLLPALGGLLFRQIRVGSPTHHPSQPRHRLRNDNWAYYY